MTHAKLCELRKRLRSAGWTQRALAEACNVTQAHISFVLRGKRSSQRLLERLCELSRTKSETTAR
ncbi:helix-turn-helix domain-containing protein [Haloferula luteola]|uniref:helix-turn-helix domain-containing protein n=1 Tax=Haloferula luteola TaxID=595692 RepID=UPI0016114BB8